jgi:hypothetical protein
MVKFAAVRAGCGPWADQRRGVVEAVIKPSWSPGAGLGVVVAQKWLRGWEMGGGWAV